jgi:hypothetical protein
MENKKEEKAKTLFGPAKPHSAHFHCLPSTRPTKYTARRCSFAPTGGTEPSVSRARWYCVVGAGRQWLCGLSTRDSLHRGPHASDSSPTASPCMAGARRSRAIRWGTSATSASLKVARPGSPRPPCPPTSVTHLPLLPVHHWHREKGRERPSLPPPLWSAVVP